MKSNLATNSAYGQKHLPQYTRNLGFSAQPKTTESEETYIVSKATDKCNAKIRAALMDIKVLVAEDRGLEQWKPVLKAGFPLESSVIADPGLSQPRTFAAGVAEIDVRARRIPRP